MFLLAVSSTNDVYAVFHWILGFFNNFPVFVLNMFCFFFSLTNCSTAVFFWSFFVVLSFDWKLQGDWKSH